MDAILNAHHTLERKANLSQTLADVSTLIERLQTTRDAVETNPELGALHLAKLKAPVKASFDAIEEDLKEVNKGLNQYQKALSAKWKNAALPTAVNGALGEQPELVDRAVAMHLLREGMFGVADTFVRQVNERQAQRRSDADADAGADDEGRMEVDDTDDGDEDDEGEEGRVSGPGGEGLETWIRDFAQEGVGVDDDGDGDGMDTRETSGNSSLQKRFGDMYHILDRLRTHHDLEPAIAWSRQHTAELDLRGSTLEFELARLKFISLYTSTSSPDLTGPLRALDYARATFPAFSHRYATDTASLLGSLAFAPALDQSPYAPTFYNSSTWSDVSTAFTLDFCSLLGLSPTSPLRTAITAGGIALPTLSKVEKIMAQSRGQWTSVNELPVETPLPPGYLFHSIFVCPVSKEQATDANPPMLLPCGHVIAKESLEMHARGKARMKCPYCPGESAPKDAKRVYI